MKKEEEKEVKNFFFILANNLITYTPFYQALLNITEPYIESLKAIPKSSKYYHISREIAGGLYVKTGRATENDIACFTRLEESYKPGMSYYEEKELYSFQLRRMVFVEALGKIASGMPLSEIGGIAAIISRASELQPMPYFKVSDDKTKAVELPSGTDVASSHKISGYKELDGIFQLACLSLTLFLADEGQGRIKKCPYCGKFFPAKDKKRQLCYDNPSCFKEYKRLEKRKQREVDPVRYL